MCRMTSNLYFWHKICNLNSKHTISKEIMVGVELNSPVQKFWLSQQLTKIEPR